ALRLLSLPPPPPPLFPTRRSSDLAHVHPALQRCIGGARRLPAARVSRAHRPRARELSSRGNRGARELVAQGRHEAARRQFSRDRLEGRTSVVQSPGHTVCRFLVSN